MKFKVFLAALLIFSGLSFAAMSPPIYIADPGTLECKYYFAGEADCFDTCMAQCPYSKQRCYEECADPCHYNPRPENFTVNIGFVGDYKDQDEACAKWKCSFTGGQWADGCQCKGQWNNETGCVAATVMTTTTSTTGMAATDPTKIAGIVVIIIIAVIVILAMKRRHKKSFKEKLNEDLKQDMPEKKYDTEESGDNKNEGL